MKSTMKEFGNCCICRQTTENVKRFAGLPYFVCDGVCKEKADKQLEVFCDNFKKEVSQFLGIK
jgi:hypothetical protein